MLSGLMMPSSQFPWQPPVSRVGNNFFNQTFNIIVNMQMEGASGSPGPVTNTYYYAKNIVVKRGRAVGF
jgi:hypothetical protein